MLGLITTIFLCLGFFVAGLFLNPVIMDYLTKPKMDDLKDEDYGC